MKNKIIILASIFLVGVVVVVGLSFFLLLTVYPTGSEPIDSVIGKVTPVYGIVVNGISYFSSKPFPEFIVDIPVDDAVSIGAADFDGDGDTDILATADSENFLAWWRNDGKKFLRGIAFTKFIVESGYGIGYIDIDIADFDGDGDKDIIGAESGLVTPYSKLGPAWGNEVVEPIKLGLVWWRNDRVDSTTKKVVFTKLLIDKDGLSPVYVDDFDKDGNSDILGVVRNEQGLTNIAWWRNDGKGSFRRTIIDREENTFTVSPADFVYSADFDRDGNQDVLSAGHSSIIWWKNEGRGIFIPKVISRRSTWGNLWDIRIADIDGDGSEDVIGATSNSIIWWKNNGKGTFEEIVIEQHSKAPTSVDIADFDKDGNLDIVVVYKGEGWQPLVWIKNDGKGNFTKIIIGKILGGSHRARTFDIDGDGDKDILAGAAWINTLTWWKNNLKK